MSNYAFDSTPQRIKASSLRELKSSAATNQQIKDRLERVGMQGLVEFLRRSIAGQKSVDPSTVTDYDVFNTSFDWVTILSHTEQCRLRQA